MENWQVPYLSRGKMLNQEGAVTDGEKESAVSIPISEFDDWANFADDDIMQQQSAIHAEEAKKIPFVGDKVRNENDSFRLLNMVAFCLNFVFILFYFLCMNILYSILYHRKSSVDLFSFLLKHYQFLCLISRLLCRSDTLSVLEAYRTRMQFLLSCYCLIILFYQPKNIYFVINLV